MYRLMLQHVTFFISCGYTGEDGFEIAMPAEYAVSIASKLISDPTVNPTGLGARDSLRLEAGLCLYGHDLDEAINPVEATLAWTMGGPKSRRRLEGGFLGAEHILTPDGGLQKVTKKRVGLMGMKAPAREGAEIFDATGEKKIGVVTSGTFSPCLKGNHIYWAIFARNLFHFAARSRTHVCSSKLHSSNRHGVC